RAAQFPTLNQFGGMRRFLDRSESEHDVLSASHAGTAISTAVGLAQALRERAEHQHVIAVVGDGTLGEGLAWEGLNYLAGTDLPLVVVINDNSMSIPPTVGGIRRLGWRFFADLGLDYIPCPDGHNITRLCSVLQDAKKQSRHAPVVVHVKTEKGR